MRCHPLLSLILVAVVSAEFHSHQLKTPNENLACPRFENWQPSTPDAQRKFQANCDALSREWRKEYVENTQTSITFSAQFTDDLVLQRAPHQSAVYGAVIPQSSTSASHPQVEVTVSGEPNKYNKKYQADVIPSETNGQWDWKVYLDVMDGSTDNTFTMTAVCTSGCDSSTTTSANISRVMFGDVFFCSGQSNMVLTMHYTFSRNITYDKIKKGSYSNVRYFTMYQNSLSNPVSVVPPHSNVMWNRPSNTTLDTFSAACWYFAQSLVDFKFVPDNIPIGLITSAVGGTMIEAWTANHTISTRCMGTICPGPGCGNLFNGMLFPFVNMTIKSALWYQGENNIYELNGFSSWVNGTGYGCMEPLMVSQWRELWSVKKGTTDPMFPFGVTSIATGGNEGHPHIDYFRWAQTANYGILPNQKMPNTFVAQTYDLQDPWAKQCYYLKPSPCRGDVPWSWDATHYFMGPIHPRDKLPVGQRLAFAGVRHIYGDTKQTWSGPMFIGCRLDMSKKILSLQVNETMMNGEKIMLSEFVPLNRSIKIYDASVMKIQLSDETEWTKVNVTLSNDQKNTVVVDVSEFYASGKTVVGVAYGWGAVYCCGSLDMSRNPCPPASCNIKSSESKLPAVPFLATIEDGKCVCPDPMKCV